MLVLAVAVRPDNLAFALAITLWIAGVHTQRRVAAATAIASASLFVVITRTLAYPWHVIIAHTFVERLVSPQQVAQARVRLDDYVRLVALGTRGHFTPHRSTWPLFLLLTIAVIIGAAPHRKGLGIKDVRLLGLIWLSCVAHFIAFPMLADRFFIAQYLAIVFIAACWFRPPSAFATASPR
ncbi:MAG TPA: hypothetical protein VGP93_06255 [Polyangiaceae bacterium]|nr:hypothetical protein [Polyangiaceae bacterium]